MMNWLYLKQNVQFVARRTAADTGNINDKMTDINSVVNEHEIILLDDDDDDDDDKWLFVIFNEQSIELYYYFEDELMYFLYELYFNPDVSYTMCVFII